MGKNIKSYATTPVHFPRKGREASWQKVQIFQINMVQLNRTHLFLHFEFTIYKQNFSNLRLPFGKISSELCKFHAIRARIP